jgi:hypothetical protein
MAFGQLENRAGVGDVTDGKRHTLLVIPLDHILEPRELEPGRAQIGRVGIREVRVDPFHDRVPALRRALEQAARIVVVHPDALHARVDLEVHGRRDAHGARRLVDLPELVDGRRRQGEPVTQEDGDLVPEDASHHENGQRDAGAAQRHRFLEKRDAERRRAERHEVARDLDESVTVGIRLHDRHHGSRRHRSLDRPEVLGETGQVDLDHRGPENVPFREIDARGHRDRACASAP